MGLELPTPAGCSAPAGPPGPGVHQGAPTRARARHCTRPRASSAGCKSFGVPPRWCTAEARLLGPAARTPLGRTRRAQTCTPGGARRREGKLANSGGKRQKIIHKILDIILFNGVPARFFFTYSAPTFQSLQRPKVDSSSSRRAPCKQQLVALPTLGSSPKICANAVGTGCGCRIG